VRFSLKNCACIISDNRPRFGNIVGFEALVRWQHPTRGLLQPLSFIPFAEEIGFIHNIDRFVLTEACSQARRWQSLGLAPAGLLMSVNLSAREISDSSIRESVSLSLLETGFEPKHLILEITESALLRDVEATIRNLQSLKSLGFEHRRRRLRHGAFLRSPTSNSCPSTF